MQGADCRDDLESCSVSMVLRSLQSSPPPAPLQHHGIPVPSTSKSRILGVPNNQGFSELLPLPLPLSIFWTSSSTQDDLDPLRPSVGPSNPHSFCLLYLLKPQFLVSPSCASLSPATQCPHFPPSASCVLLLHLPQHWNLWLTPLSQPSTAARLWVSPVLSTQRGLDSCFQED